MGRLTDFPLNRWRAEYALTTLVETGTALGDGVIAGVNAGFARVISIELLPHVAIGAARRIESKLPALSHRWEIRLGDSADLIGELTDELSAGSRVMWWLDAHYPERYVEGAPARPTGPVVERPELGTRLPLLQEVKTLAERRQGFARDVVLVDDWRIYSEITPAEGALPAFFRSADGGLTAKPQGAEIQRILATSHRVRADLRGTGYLVCLPR